MMYNPYTIGMPSQMGVGAQYGQMGYNPMQQPTMQQNAPQSEMTYVLPVASVKEFDTVTIQPGRRALLMAQNDPYIAFKSADAMGMVTTNLYRLEPVTADQINGPAPEYVTRSEFQQTIQQLIDSMSKPARAKKETVSE